MSRDRTLTDADVQAIARATAELLGGAPAARYVDAQAVAHRLSVSVDYVYEHAEDLGAIRLGTGRRAPLRFDVRAIDARMLELRDGKPPRPKRPRRRSPAAELELLPVAGNHLRGPIQGRHAP